MLGILLISTFTSVFLLLNKWLHLRILFINYFCKSEHLKEHLCVIFITVEDRDIKTNIRRILGRDQKNIVFTFKKKTTHKIIHSRNVTFKICFYCKKKNYEYKILRFWRRKKKYKHIFYVRSGTFQSTLTTHCTLTITHCWFRWQLKRVCFY